MVTADGSKPSAVTRGGGGALRGAAARGRQRPEGRWQPWRATARKVAVTLEGAAREGAATPRVSESKKNSGFDTILLERDYRGIR
jgi:hypothetical protein